jgi:hypothetical protein
LRLEASILQKVRSGVRIFSIFTRQLKSLVTNEL